MLHCAVTSAVTLIAGRVSVFLFRRNGSYGSYVSGLLFAAHPIHCEAVAGLVGRADLVCTLFFLAGLFTYSRRNLTGTLVLICAAFLSKEYGIMLTPVCLLYDLVVLNRFRINRTIFNWVVLIAWSIALVMFRFWLSGFQTPQFARADNPTAASPSWITRSLTFLYLPVIEMLMKFEKITRLIFNCLGIPLWSAPVAALAQFRLVHGRHPARHFTQRHPQFGRAHILHCFSHGHPENCPDSP